MVSVFDYTDYRRYLSALYTERKGENPHFSHRYIAQKLALKSTGHFAQIISGKVNISAALALKFSEFLKHSKKEADYFASMVLFGQAKTRAEKGLYFERLMESRGAKPTVLESDKYLFYNKWYFTAVFECIGVGGFDGDYEQLARTIEPSLSIAEARESVELLLDLELLAKSDSGQYFKTNRTISTGFGTQLVAVDNFQVAMMQRAQEALDRFEREERNFSTLTLGLSAQEYEEVINELRAFRRRVLEIASGAQKAQRVYQFNFQVFPLTRVVEG